MEIKIVKYEEAYASKVAEMWNHSRDGWGGANTVDTKETVLHREKNSTNIHTFLALENEKVVGYCGLSEYREDEGALYIPLLNVRDDYHGKKIGKKLLLTALQEVIHLQWPRLDLYTWPGNTKAVPLYKKCGFFWEDRDDTTHLLNFMPTVLHTEAVQDFFENVNWYDVSTRKIEVKPDGRIENDFHYYEYAWEKDKESLRIEFERTGRGIRLIETDDYYISATVPSHQLVFGNQYSIRYKIINKSGKPLHIDLIGSSDKNIAYQLERSIDVTDEAEVEGSFYVNPVEEEQNNFRTHPAVQTTIRINGKQAIFKTGILPKYPTQIAAHLPEDLTFIGKESVFYLDLMNNFSEKVRFELEFPSSTVIEMENRQLFVEMEAKERKSIALPFVVQDFGYYNANLNIRAINEKEEEVQFSKVVGIPLRGIGAQFYGEDEESVQLYNGQYFAALKKQGNRIQIGKKKEDIHLIIMTPKVGKPYSEEIARRKLEKVEFSSNTGYISAKITYSLEAFPAVKLHTIMKLYSEGLVENYYEVENTQNEQTKNPLWVNQSIYFDLEKAVIPYQGEIVEMNDSLGNSYENWDNRQITENWIFIKDASNPIGVSWNSNDKIHFNSWYSYLEHNLGQIEAKGSLKTNSVFLSIGAFQDAESFRAFAQQAAVSKKVKPVNHLRVSLENNNPIVQGDEVICKVTDYKSNYLHGELSLSFFEEEENTEAFDRKAQKQEWVTKRPLVGKPSISTIKLKAKLDAAVLSRETLVIRQRDVDVKESVVNEQGVNTWKVNNGVIEIKAAPEFFPALYSLTYQNHEWLDSSFPALQPKSWWNPWSGGLSSGLSDINHHSLSKEKTSAAFAGLRDNKGNEWRGIKLSTTIEENEAFKGLAYHQYFLLLPGAPVLCHVSEIQQETGTFFNGKDWQTVGFFKSGKNIQDNWVNIQDQAGEWTKVVVGKDEHDLSVGRNMIIGSNDNENEQLQLISNRENTLSEAYVNKEILLTSVEEKLIIPSATTQFTTPSFYIFSDNVIPDFAQYDLQVIRF